MKISKLGSALAFSLAFSAGQAHAEPWQLKIVNKSSKAVTYVMVANQGNLLKAWIPPFNQNPPPPSAVVNFDKPSCSGKMSLSFTLQNDYATFASIDCNATTFTVYDPDPAGLHQN